MYIIVMVDKVIASISYIRTFSKKKRRRRLLKSEDEDKTWLTVCLKELLSDITAENQIELVDGQCKINENKEIDSNCDEDSDLFKAL